MISASWLLTIVLTATTSQPTQAIDQPTPEASQTPTPTDPVETGSLHAAIAQANAALRKPGAESLTTDDLRAVVPGHYRFQLRNADITQQNDGTWLVTTPISVNRTPIYNDAADQDRIRQNKAALSTAQRDAKARLAAFDKRWKRHTKSKNGEVVTIWRQPGCQKRHPPISDETHASRRQGIITDGKAAIDAAETAYESSKVQSRERRESVMRRIRTVNATLTLPTDAPEVESLRAGRDAVIFVQVKNLGVDHEPTEIVRAGRYVNALTLELAPKPELISLQSDG